MTAADLLVALALVFALSVCAGIGRRSEAPTAPAWTDATRKAVDDCHAVGHQPYLTNAGHVVCLGVSL